MEDNYISTYKDEVEDITTIKMSGALHYSEVSSEFFMNMNLCRIITSDTDSLSFQIMSNSWRLRRLVFRLNDSKVISLECEETDVIGPRHQGPLSYCYPFRLTIEQFRDICSANKVIYKVCDSYRDNFFIGKSEWDMLLEYCRVFYTQAYEINTFPTASSDYEKKINNIVNPILEKLFPKIGSKLDTGKLDMIPDVLRDFIDGRDDFNGVEVERFTERLIEKLKTSIECSKNKSTKSDTKRPESDTKRPKSTTSKKMDNHIVVKKVWVDTDGVGQLFVHCDWLANNMKGESLEFRVNLKAKSGKKVKFDASVNQWYYLLEKFRPQNDSHQFKNTCCAIPQADFNMVNDEKKKLEFNIEVYKWGTNECVYSSKKMAFTVWFYFNFFSKNKFEVRSQQCEL